VPRSLSTRIALLLFVTIASQTALAKNRAFSSFAAFFAAPSSEVQRRLGAQPLDTTKPLDRSVRGALDELDTFNQMHTAVYWSTGVGSHAHRQAGIGLNRAQLARLAQEQDGERFRQIVLFVLAHEQAHMAQYNFYSNGLDDRQKRRAIECQADILGGMSFTAVLLKRRTPLQDFDTMSQRLVALTEKIGSPEWDDQTTHPRPEQRARAITLGILSRIQLADWDYYDRSKDPETLRRLRSAESRFSDIIRKGDNFFEWSNRTAKKIVRYPQ
jgi:hypothetical protein